MGIPCDKTFLVPSARSSVKVKYRGHSFWGKKKGSYGGISVSEIQLVCKCNKLPFLRAWLIFFFFFFFFNLAVKEQKSQGIVMTLIFGLLRCCHSRFLCPCIERWGGGHIVFPWSVCMSICLSVRLSVCLHKLNVKT